jgi:hypothetical protein
MKNFLVVNRNNANNFFITDNLNALIVELFANELEKNAFSSVEELFKATYKVFKVDGTIEA